MRQDDRVKIPVRTTQCVAWEVRTCAKAQGMTLSDYIGEAVHRHVFAVDKDRDFLNDLVDETAKTLRSTLRTHPPSERLALAAALLDRAAWEAQAGTFFGVDCGKAAPRGRSRLVKGSRVRLWYSTVRHDAERIKRQARLEGLSTSAFFMDALYLQMFRLSTAWRRGKPDRESLPLAIAAIARIALPRGLWPEKRLELLEPIMVRFKDGSRAVTCRSNQAVRLPRSRRRSGPGASMGAQAYRAQRPAHRRSGQPQRRGHRTRARISKRGKG